MLLNGVVARTFLNAKKCGRRSC